MNLLYWNLKNNENLEPLLRDCIIINAVDIVILSEYDGIDFVKLAALLKNQFSEVDELQVYKDIKILYRANINLSLSRAQYRYTIVKLLQNGKSFLITGVHLPSNLHRDGSGERKHIIRKIINDIVEEEAEEIYSSLIIGDMNANPFDGEMIEKDAFNSVLFKQIIRNQETVKYQNDVYRRFYNPIIEYINETNQDYGSYYYSSGNLYWYCFDQILVRKNLMDDIKSFKYIKQIGNTHLLSRVRPKKEISDHLPLLVTINI